MQSNTVQLYHQIIMTHPLFHYTRKYLCIEEYRRESGEAILMVVAVVLGGVDCLEFQRCERIRKYSISLIQQLSTSV